MIPAGKLNKLLTIEEPRTIPNEINEGITSWQPVASIWGSLEPLNARELEHARSVQMQTTHRIRTHYTPVITSSTRLTYSPPGCDMPRVFSIDGIRNPDEANRELVISAVEVTGG